MRLRSGYFSVFIRVSEGRGGCVRSLALWREGEWRPGRTGLPELYSFSRYDPAAEVAPGSRIPPADIVEIDLVQLSVPPDGTERPSPGARHYAKAIPWRPH